MPIFTEGCPYIHRKYEHQDAYICVKMGIRDAHFRGFLFSLDTGPEHSSWSSRFSKLTMMESSRAGYEGYFRTCRVNWYWASAPSLLALHATQVEMWQTSIAVWSPAPISDRHDVPKEDISLMSTSKGCLHQNLRPHWRGKVRGMEPQSIGRWEHKGWGSDSGSMSNTKSLWAENQIYSNPHTDQWHHVSHTRTRAHSSPSHHLAGSPSRKTVTWIQTHQWQLCSVIPQRHCQRCKPARIYINTHSQGLCSNSSLSHNMWTPDHRKMRTQRMRSRIRRSGGDICWC